MSLFEATAANYRALHDATRWIDRAPDETLAQIRLKEELYHKLANDPEYIKARLLADAWCAAFVWEKISPRPDADAEGLGVRVPPMTDLLYRRMEENPLAENLRPVRQYIVELTQRYQFFHWHVAFPDVFTVPDDSQDAENEQTGWEGGFDCVLGNPPWEHTEIKEKEWFAERAPEIASAVGAKRKQLIANLHNTDPDLFDAFAAEKRAADGFSHFVRTSSNYPLTGRGRINTYPLFTEESRHIINDYGRIGIIVPSGIATDDTTKFLFQDLMETQSLVSLYSFENEEFLFAGIHHAFKFCLLTMSGFDAQVESAKFVFYARQVPHLNEDWRRFTLSVRDINLINPNTGTTAIFRSVYDAEITKAIYQRVPILLREEPLENPWNITFKQGLYNMTSDSHLFRTHAELNSEGYTLYGNHFLLNDMQYLPLYEAKMIRQFDHRFSTYQDATESNLNSGILPQIEDEKKRDAFCLPMPRYWVSKNDILERLQKNTFVSFRRISSTTNERTFIATLMNLTAAGDSVFLMLSDQKVSLLMCITANLSAFTFDFVVRQKMGGSNLSFFIVEQLPVIPPHTYTAELLDFIVPRVLELTYTAWDLQPFAQDVGYHGAPFIWDEERRFLMRCELDALYFHLYQIQRDDVDYIMETFPIVKRKDIAATADGTHPLAMRERGPGGEGEYLTKRIILEMYDQMAALPTMHVPAPKDESTTYAVPDVSHWQTWLNPPPADPSVAHPDQ